MHSIYEIVVAILIGLFTVDASRSIGYSDAPWFVAIERNGQFICSASIIGERWILASDYCFAYATKPAQHYKIRYDSSIYSIIIKGIHRNSAAAPVYHSVLIELDEPFKWGISTYPIHLLPLVRLIKLK